MSKATANRTALYRVKEVTWGSTPANPPLIETRMTGEALDDAITFEKSKELRSDRQLTDTIAVDSSPSGSFNIEMSYGTYADLLESALMSVWSTPLAINGNAADISTTTDPASNLTSGTAGKFSSIVEGQKIRLAGFTGSVSGIYTVVDKVSNQALTLSPVPAAAETPLLAAAQIRGSYIRNGVTEQSYTLVKQFNDATAMTRQIFRGMRVGGLSLELATAAIMTGAFNFMGKSAEFTEDTFAGESFVDASTTEVMNAVTNLMSIYQDDAAIGTDGSVMSMSLEIDNQHREQKGLGVLGNVGIAAGQLLVNVTASQYFESKEQADKFKASTAFKFGFILRDNSGNELHFTFPRCKYESFVVNASQLDSDVMAETTFTALRDPATNCMIQIDAFPVA